jgi:hypothetical protein
LDTSFEIPKGNRTVEDSFNPIHVLFDIKILYPG